MCGRRLLARRDLVPMQAAGTVGDEGEQPGTLGSIRLCSVGVKAGESPTVGHTPTPRIDVWLSETRPARRPIVPQRCAPSYFPPRGTSLFESATVPRSVGNLLGKGEGGFPLCASDGRDGGFEPGSVT